MIKQNVLIGVLALLFAPISASGMVISSKTSPDGQWFVELADYSVPGRMELWSTPTAGGARKLIAPMTQDRNVIRFDISVHNVVAYVSDELEDQRYELFAATAVGGVATKRISAPICSDCDVDALVITPDGSRVVYHAGQLSFGKWDLWSVGIAGGNAKKISPPMGVGGAVDASYFVTADSKTAIYRADAVQNGMHNIYTVPVGGGVSKQISGTLPQWGDVRDMELTPGGEVRHEADYGAVGNFRWWLVGVGGGRILEEVFNDGFESGGVTRWE